MLKLHLVCKSQIRTLLLLLDKPTFTRDWNGYLVTCKISEYKKEWKWTIDFIILELRTHAQHELSNIIIFVLRRHIGMHELVVYKVNQAMTWVLNKADKVVRSQNGYFPRIQYLDTRNKKKHSGWEMTFLKNNISD